MVEFPFQSPFSNLGFLRCRNPRQEIASAFELWKTWWFHGVFLLQVGGSAGLAFGIYLGAKSSFGKEQWIWTHCSLTCTFNDEVELMLWWNIVSVKKMPMGCATYFGATYHRGQDVRNHLEVISQLNKNDAVRWCQIISEKSSNIRRKQTINLHVFFQACSWFQSFWDDIIANLIPTIWPWGLIWTKRARTQKLIKLQRQVSATSCWESMWSQSESPEQMSPSPFQPQ